MWRHGLRNPKLRTLGILSLSCVVLMIGSDMNAYRETVRFAAESPHAEVLAEDA